MNGDETGGAKCVELLGDKRKAYRILERKPLGKPTSDLKKKML
jgi:hypothetical protein